jgi:5'-nucleotidase
VSEPVIKAKDPHGRDIYWVGPVGAAKEAGEGTDFHATAQGAVSITPLRVDLTHQAQLAGLHEGLA